MVKLLTGRERRRGQLVFQNNFHWSWRDNLLFCVIVLFLRIVSIYKKSLWWDCCCPLFQDFEVMWYWIVFQKSQSIFITFILFSDIKKLIFLQNICCLKFFQVHNFVSLLQNPPAAQPNSHKSVRNANNLSQNIVTQWGVPKFPPRSP